jgi:hypothetical protein
MRRLVRGCVVSAGGGAASRLALERRGRGQEVS